MAGYARRVSTYDPDSTRIGWVGTGVMGASMCGHLLAGGYPVTVYSRHPRARRAAPGAGRQLGGLARGGRGTPDVVFTMVGYPADVREVILGDDGVLGDPGPAA